MQDLNTLRARVDETAEKLATAESERRDRTTSLISMLQSLEEKFTAQEEELIHYRQRIEPLESANTELAALMEKLLDLIDAGFDRGSLGSLQEAVGLATEMLGGAAPSAETAPEAGNASTEADGATELDDGLSGQVDSADAAGWDEDRPLDPPAGTEDGPSFDAAAEEEPAVPPADGGSEEPVAQVDAAEVAANNAEQAVEEQGFEDVSAAALDLETEEDAAAGTDDLPSMVCTAAERATDDGLVSDPALAEEIDMADVAEEIAAAVNAEAQIDTDDRNEDGGDPADDIRALLARVEVLAAKAESMRGAESDEDASAEAPAPKASSAA